MLHKRSNITDNKNREQKKIREITYIIALLTTFCYPYFFSDFFLDFSRELNFTDNNLNMISGMENFCDISRELHFAEKFKIREIRLTHWSCIRELSWSTWSCTTAYGRSFWLYRSLTINNLNINIRIVINLIGLISMKIKKICHLLHNWVYHILVCFSMWPLNLPLSLGIICTRCYVLYSTSFKKYFYSTLKFSTMITLSSLIYNGLSSKNRENTRFFYKQRFFSAQPHCCLTFSWIELKMLQPLIYWYTFYICTGPGLFMPYICDLFFIFSLAFIVINHKTSFFRISPVILGWYHEWRKWIIFK